MTGQDTIARIDRGGCVRWVLHKVRQIWTFAVLLSASLCHGQNATIQFATNPIEFIEPIENTTGTHRFYRARLEP